MANKQLLEELLNIDIENTSLDELTDSFISILRAHDIQSVYTSAGEQNLPEYKSNEVKTGSSFTIKFSDNSFLKVINPDLTGTEIRYINRLLKSLYRSVECRCWTQSDFVAPQTIENITADKSINSVTIDLMGEKALIGAWTLDITEEKLYWSKAVRKIHAVDDDYQEDVAGGINFYKEGWSRNKITEVVNRALETGESWDEELIIIDAKGKEKWVRALGRAFTLGKNQVLSGIFQDISEQKALIESLQKANALEEEKSRRLKLAVKSAKIGFWDLNLETNALQWDAGMFEIYGSDPDTFQSSFEDWSKLVHEDDLEGAVNAIDETLKGNVIFDSEFRITNASSGEERYIKANAQVIHTMDKTPSRLVGVNIDITDEKKYIKKQEELAQLAREASQAKSQFLASMSHEIRTPLNGVIGMLGLLQQDDLSEDTMTKVKVADRSAHTLLALINDVLDLSKIEDGSMNVENITFSLDHTVSTITDIFQFPISEKELHFNVQKDYPTGLNIVSDPVRLRQIIVNLISNAIKFTEKGEIGFFIEVVQEHNIAHLNIKVKDTGIGIPKELHEKLFLRFTQADASTTRKFGGTGLGLAITKNLIELLGGEISLESEVGIGTEFTLSFPIQINESHVTDQEEDAQSARKIELDSDLLPELGHILVVEDNRVNQMVISAQLKNHCQELTIAENGQEAIEMMQANEDTFDMILMDCEMPLMDGYKATELIREGKAGGNYHAIPIIALTAKAYKEDRDRCFEVGMNGFVAKPIDVNELLNEMYRLLSHS